MPTAVVLLAPLFFAAVLLTAMSPACAAAWAQDSTTGLRWSHSLALRPQAAPADLPELQTGAPTPWSQLLRWADERAAANRAADAGALAAQAQSRQAWAAAWMPRLDANASGFQQKQTYNGVNLSIPTSSFTLAATLPLWRAGERASARAQDALAEQARWQARSSRASVARELSLAYVAAAEAAEQQRLGQAQQQLLQDQLRINERRLSAGAGTILDVLETRTRLDQARAALQDTATRLASQRLLIERLSGQAVVLPRGLNERSELLPMAVPPQAEAQAQLMARNPQVQDAQAQAQAAQLSLQGREAEYWQPTVDAVAQANRSRQVQRFEGISEEQNTTTRSIGLQLNWPLYTGGVQTGRTQEGAALLTQASARSDEAQSQAQASLQDAYQTLSQAQAVVQVQREVEQTATATFDALKKAFVAGLRTNIDLLNAQQQIYSARQSLVGARVAALGAQINILALLDQLDALHVAPLSTMFDPTPLPERTLP